MDPRRLAAGHRGGVRRGLRGGARAGAPPARAARAARDGHGDLRCEHVLARPRSASSTASSSTRSCAAPTWPATWRSWLWIWRSRGSAGPPASCSRLPSRRHEPGRRGAALVDAAHWAPVRAKVALITAAERAGDSRARARREAQQLWSLSERLCWRARAPLAVVICGPAGSGKSVLAAELSRRSEMPVVSSDVVRKRLAHLARSSRRARSTTARASLARPTSGLPATRCSSSSARAARDRRCDLPLARGARVAARPAGWTHGLSCLIVRGEVPLELALERAVRRMHDPRRVSDATPPLTEEQFRSFRSSTSARGQFARLDYAQALDAQVAAVAGRGPLRPWRRGGRRCSPGRPRKRDSTSQVGRNLQSPWGESPMKGLHGRSALAHGEDRH